MPKNYTRVMIGFDSSMLPMLSQVKTISKFIYKY